VSFVTVKILAIAAMDESRVIGKEGGIPWHFSDDMKRFAALTTGHTVLMGRKTYDSLPPGFKPLPRRKNVIVTRDPDAVEVNEEVDVVASPEAYIEEVKSGARDLCSELLWIGGGEEMYRVTMPYWDEVFLTLVNGTHGGDTFLPEFESNFDVVDKEDKGGYSWLRYVRRS